MAGAWGYREEMKKSESWILAILIPSFAGGLIGGILLRYTPQQTFKNLVPFLILFATFLFIIQGPVQKFLKSRRDEVSGTASLASRSWLAYALPVQFLTGIYGGYFGAGLGMIVLASLGLALDDNMTRLNALKQAISFSVNTAAALFFLFSGNILWPVVLVMAVAALAGGSLGGRLAGRVSPDVLRWTVVSIGLIVAIIYLVR